MVLLCGKEYRCIGEEFRHVLGVFKPPAFNTYQEIDMCFLPGVHSQGVVGEDVGWGVSGVLVGLGGSEGETGRLELQCWCFQ